MNDTKIASKANAQLANFMGKVFTIVRAINDGIRPIYTEIF